MKQAIAIVIALVTILITGCTPSEDPKMQACFRYLTFYSENEYNEYLTREADNLPDVFVKWDDIKMLGEFSGFGLADYYYSYWYSFIDENSNELILYVDHAAAKMKSEKKELASLPTTVLPTGATSMKMANCTQQSIITRNGMTYYYIPSGKLLNIIWFDENTVYTLSGGLSRYSENEATTFVARILSSDNSKMAVAFAEIKQSLDARK